MHAILVAMVLAVGADQQISAANQTPPAGNQPVIGAVQMPYTVGQPDQFPRQTAGAPAGFPDVPGPYHYDPPRDPQESDGLICGFLMYCRAWWQPMPQTCYGPHYGCYPGNNRDIHRYPAFHGNYYRQAYNYRPLFEYPWQARMQEPLPLELSSERSMVVRPQAQPQVEVIKTPPTNPPYSVP